MTRTTIMKKKRKRRRKMNLNNFKQNYFVSLKYSSNRIIIIIHLGTTLYLFDFLLMVSEKKYYFTKRATSVQFSWPKKWRLQYREITVSRLDERLNGVGRAPPEWQPVKRPRSSFLTSLTRGKRGFSQYAFFGTIRVCNLKDSDTWQTRFQSVRIFLAQLKEPQQISDMRQTRLQTVWNFDQAFLEASKSHQQVLNQVSG